MIDAPNVEPTDNFNPDDPLQWYFGMLEILDRAVLASDEIEVQGLGAEIAPVLALTGEAAARLSECVRHFVEHELIYEHNVKDDGLTLVEFQVLINVYIAYQAKSDPVMREGYDERFQRSVDNLVRRGLILDDFGWLKPNIV